MRNSILLTITLLLFFAQIAVQGQKTKFKDPPKAAFYATDFVDEEGWKRYVSNEGKFDFLLPSAPERKVKFIDFPTGKKSLITYSATANKMVYVVGYLDYKMPVNDEAALRQLYDGWQEGITSAYPNGEVEQKVTEYEGKLARELTYVSGIVSIKAKAFFTKGKLFQMLILHIIEGDDALLRDVSRDNEKFFNSLKLETTVVETKNVSLIGEIRENAYQNNYFNFSLTLPKDWVVIDKEDTNLMKEGTKERVTQQGKQSAITSINRTTFLFNLTRSEIGSMNNASVIGAAESGLPAKATLQQIATALSISFTTKSGYTTVKPITYPKIGSATFAVLHLKRSNSMGMILHQKIYITRSRGYLLEFIGTFAEDEEPTAFDEMMKTIKFSGRK